MMFVSIILNFVMYNLKYHRIYDSGQSKYIMQIKKDLN